MDHYELWQLRHGIGQREHICAPRSKNWAQNNDLPANPSQRNTLQSVSHIIIRWPLNPVVPLSYRWSPFSPLTPCNGQSVPSFSSKSNEKPIFIFLRTEKKNRKMKKFQHTLPTRSRFFFFFLVIKCPDMPCPPNRNYLPPPLSPTLSCFKNRLDRFYETRGIVYSY